jgi:ATP-dependent helicase HrpA
VPGLLEEKVAALLRSVPPRHRHRLQPMAESAADFMLRHAAGDFDVDAPLLKALQRFVEERVSLKLPQESFRAENLNPHCFMNFRVHDEHGRILGQSRQLAELRTRFREQVAARFQGATVPAAPAAAAATPRGTAARPAESRRETPATPAAPVAGYTSWTFGALPELLEVKVAGRDIVGFPALHDDGASVSLRPYDTPEEAARVHRRGLARLFALELAAQVKAVEKLPGIRELALQFITYGNDAELKAQLVTATLECCCLIAPLPNDAEGFAQRCKDAKPRIGLVAQELMRLAGQLIVEHATLMKRVGGLKTFPELVADVNAQVARLMPKNFLVALPFAQLAQIPRYLKAATVRIDKLRANPARDAQLLAEWRGLAQPFEREWLTKTRAGVLDPQLEEFRWLLEELRVGLFAQELKTPMPVSVKRLQKIWENRPR